ncbi:unnamed protein product [Ixodes pacificus]
MPKKDEISFDIQESPTLLQNQNICKMQAEAISYSPQFPRGCFQMLKRDAWLLTLVYCEFWISAAFGLLQPFFPVLVSPV